MFVSHTRRLCLQLRAQVITAGQSASVHGQNAGVFVLDVRVDDSHPLILGDGLGAEIREDAEEDESATDDCDGDEDERRAERKDDEGGDEGDCVEDVYERREDVTVEVAAQRRPDRRHYRHDRNRDAEVVEGVLRDLVHHHTAPVETNAAVDGHEYDGSRCRHLLRDAEQQREHARREDKEYS